jgi:hypothetical protein
MESIKIKKKEQEKEQKRIKELIRRYRFSRQIHRKQKKELSRKYIENQKTGGFIKKTIKKQKRYYDRLRETKLEPHKDYFEQKRRKS